MFPPFCQPCYAGSNASHSAQVRDAGLQISIRWSKAELGWHTKLTSKCTIQYIIVFPMAAMHKAVRFMKLRYFTCFIFLGDSIYVHSGVHICALLVFVHGNICICPKRNMVLLYMLHYKRLFHWNWLSIFNKDLVTEIAFQGGNCINFILI